VSNVSNETHKKSCDKRDLRTKETYYGGKRPVNCGDVGRGGEREEGRGGGCMTDSKMCLCVCVCVCVCVQDPI
jgi:hypothetical protein